MSSEGGGDDAAEVVGWSDISSKTVDATPVTEGRLKPRRKAGRPTKLNKELIERLCSYVRAGLQPSSAAVRCDIPISTYNAWLRKAAEGDPLCEQLVLEVGKASAVVEAWITSKAFDHAKKGNVDVLMKLGRIYIPSWREAERPGAGGGSGNVSVSVTAGAAASAGVGAAAAASGGSNDNERESTALTVRGADAIRKDILLGGKSVDDVRAEYQESQRKQLKAGG